MTRPSRVLALAAAAVLATAGIAAAQDAPRAAPSSPDSLLAAVLRAFESGTPDEFDRLYPDAQGRAFVRLTAERKQVREAGGGRVVGRGHGRAVLLLAGTALYGDSGDETNASRRFSGLYEAAESDGGWRLVRRLPLDSANRILAQTLHVALTPGERIEVVDTLEVSVGNPNGFAARLNHRARLRSVRLDGRPVEHAFGGGLLWVPAKRGSHRLVLAYGLDETRGADTAAARTEHGAFTNDSGWLPFFDYTSGNDLAALRLTVRLPADYQLTTSLPQTGTVRDGVRVVHARSAVPAFVAGLLYDRAWRVAEDTLGGVRVQTFLTPEFPHARDTLLAEVRRVYRVLGGTFGIPASRYVGIAEQRSLRGGFRYRANEVVISGRGGGTLETAGPVPGSILAHEVAHGWTNPAGPASNFLREGWATFAESLVLRDRYGPEVEAAFWEVRRNRYFAYAEGKRSILGDPDNGAVHYNKGAWILRMLRDAMGDSAFARGMRAYMETSAAGPAGHREFTASLSRAAGRDLEPFLEPWLVERLALDVETRVDGPRVIVTQRGPVFRLPLELALTTPTGTARRTVALTGRADTLDVAELGTVTAVRADPDGRLLLRRHRGEVVRFEVRAPDAKSVALAGDFLAELVPATRSGDRWVVELPLTEGRYYWVWLIDGELRTSGYRGETTAGVRVVRPLRHLQDALPR